MDDLMLLYLIFVPICASVLVYFLPRVRGLLATLASGATLWISVILFMDRGRAAFTGDWLSFGGISFALRSDMFSALIVGAVSAFGFLVAIYSTGFMRGLAREREYYTYLTLTIGAANGAALADSLIVLLMFWELLAVLLYGLVTVGERKTSPAVARKSFIIVGGADFLMLLGVGLLWRVTGSLNMSTITNVGITNGVTMASFLLLMSGALAKSGAMPFHTWIPDAAEATPTPVMALIPAAIDKLLGIYLLGRIALFMFNMRSSQAMGLILMIIGSITIVMAVMMALVQKELKKLLAYQTVAQVGYIVLGIGTGIPVGIVGGLFHMVNHAIYKSCLFMCGGAVERRTGKTNFDELGGLGSAMPITFLCCTVAGLAMSGVPPFSAFFSKWMVYQGVIELGGQGSKAFPIFLIAAMFGSVLTLACFINILHSVFLGERPRGLTAREVGPAMAIPMVLLAIGCIVFGIFANGIPLQHLIAPAVPVAAAWEPIGQWTPIIATILILIGLAIGFIVYLFGTIRKIQVRPTFIGGEVLEPEEVRIPGTHFFDSSVRSVALFDETYQFAEGGAFDAYTQGTSAARSLARLIHSFVDRAIDQFFTMVGELSIIISSGLRYLHSGSLPVYLGWVLAGLLILFFVFFAR